MCSSHRPAEGSDSEPVGPYRQPATEAGQSLADGEDDGLTALIVEIEDQAFEAGRLALRAELVPPEHNPRHAYACAVPGCPKYHRA